MGRLNADDGAHEHAEQRHNPQTLETDGRHLFRQQTPEHRRLFRAPQHAPQERRVTPDVEEETHAPKVRVNFAAMNLNLFRVLSASLLLVGLTCTGCTTTKATKGKCPTCPEWSVPAQPHH